MSMLPPPAVSRSAERQASVVGSTSTRHRLKMALTVASTNSLVPVRFQVNRKRSRLFGFKNAGAPEMFDATRCSPEREKV